ncbi:MAG: formylglycine-generating enzyme family protein [Treponema sp.]|nr:formylglycine-generating enzyme family protein [Treponema sp.]
MKRVIICLFLVVLSAVVFAQDLNPAPGFVRIDGGTFTMGSPANEPGRSSDEIQRQVTISLFQMSRYPVTQREYQEVMGTNPSYFRGANLPVECVSWFDAIEYCNRRSQREGLTPAYTISGSRNNRTVTWNRNANGYRLPTEAEWEYACRAGTTTAYNTGAGITTSQANFDACCEDCGESTPINRYSPNRWGLYDMHGNVWEWCWDWYGPYVSGAQTNPTGAVSGDSRVLRGGGWGDSVGDTRSASRVSFDPDYGFGIIGFRLVRP